VTLRIVRGVPDAQVEIEADKEEERRKAEELARGEKPSKRDDVITQGPPVDFSTTTDYSGFEILDLKLVRTVTPLTKPRTGVASAPPPPVRWPDASVEGGTAATAGDVGIGGEGKKDQ
jgi:hypothetical protein